MKKRVRCDRCSNRAGAVNEMGFEKARISLAVGKFRVNYRNGRVVEQFLCDEDLRGLRSSGLFEVLPA